MPATGPDSLIDVVDDTTGMPIATATRADALGTGLAVRTVHVFLLDGHDRLLLQQLGRARDRHPMLWGSSVATFPHPGEASDVAAARRSMEELGVRTSLRRLGSVRVRDGVSPKFVTLYEGTISALPQIAEPDHVQRVELWTRSDIDAAIAADPDGFTPTFRQVYAWWRDRQA